ncbi:sugar phosphate isomerase/epimerase [Plantactinospora sp. BB1]|uniref:sugar phosphate isomerase/epimerase family protein n=1 Tax=Plantactinospora sp. BB1 TaxID=2071627 RepID=UPI000D16034D|nr:sugar phosphate isomerase/epimerase [Plantactinospora sp. BB1]AVT36000.1 sugar phosphate isomerase [Plantactinospora sp. BB1]
MKLGLLTACLPGEPLDAIAGWAAGHGYRGLEVAAWPREPDRPWQASHLDVDGFDAGAAERVRALLDGHGLTVSAVAYYENNLHADPAVRERIHRHLRRCVDAAALLGCEHVGTFVGRDVTRTVTENLRLGEEVLPPLVAYAADRGVRLVVENCPMEGWHPDGYPANLAYSPELWDWLGGLGLFLNYDPSHLVWLGIDPVAALTGHLDLVRHVQAKDVQVDPAARNRFGVFGQLVGKPSPWSSGWWRYRVPGLGEVDWRRLVDVLYEGGYSGFVSVEHEDPVWSGSPERVRQGLVIAERTLNPLLVA